MSATKLNSSDLLKSFRQSEPSYDDAPAKVWIPVRSEFKGFDDVADAYVILDVPKAESSVMVFALYHDKWRANPWSSRPVIRRLLNLCGGEITDFND